jgi:phosphate transport system permease protein
MIYPANPADRRNPLKLPPPTLGQNLSAALVNGFIGAVVLSFLVALGAAILGVLRDESPQVFHLAALGGWTATCGFILCFLIGLLRRSRPLQDGTFRVTGFLATFFGLAVLLFFFKGLVVDVVDWFDYVPVLVARKNEEILETREKLRHIESIRDAEKAIVERDYQNELALAADEAAKQETIQTYKGTPELVKKLELAEAQELAKSKSPEERRAIRERYTPEIRAAGGAFADSLRILEVRIAEKTELANQPIRDTSPWAVFMHFLFEPPSNYPEAVGIRPALLGSLWLALIMIAFAVPIGTGAALYLEEYRHSGVLGYWIKVNINNLAGVPSVVYGIMGAFVFVELIFKPLHRGHEWISVRNLLGGGLTLGLLTLPVIIVSAQEAIRAVPSSIRQGAYALGATHWQVIWHQILPLARPGIMTGTILAVSRAIGEAAPLVLFGATTFIAFSPYPWTEFTALPIQIYNWGQRPNTVVVDGQEIRPWNFNMALASLILLAMLIVLNALAIYLRARAQKKVRW